MIVKSVVLPDPDGPTTATWSPRGISTLTPRSANTSPGYSLTTPSSASTIPSGGAAATWIPALVLVPVDPSSTVISSQPWESVT
jgi:hypothetical protein